jgi:RNA polymerase sigma factor (sigma-70 family)
MNEDAWLAERFEEHRARLGAVANRMLGSPHEADDAVQEAWLRFSRSDTSSVENLGSWLTTVISRVCLNMLQARRSRPETPASPDMPEPAASPATRSDPEHEALLADSIGLALLVVLDTLSPPERVALVLHDMFGMPFEEIAPIIGRTAPAARQLASRARRRVRGHGAPEGCDRVRQATLVEAFLAASRNGDFNALLALLDPGVVLRADEAAANMGVAAEILGAPDVAAFFRRAGGARPALVNGQPGAVWMPGGQPRVVFRFTISDNKIIGIELAAAPERLSHIDLVVPVPAPLGAAESVQPHLDVVETTRGSEPSALCCGGSTRPSAGLWPCGYPAGGDPARSARDV